MKRTIYDVTLSALAMIIGSCLISLMAVFMGDGQFGTDLQGLLRLQSVFAALALLIAIACLCSFVARRSWTTGLRTIWTALPQWLVFTFLLLNSLFVFGEVAFLIATRAMGHTVMWYQHVPLVCMLSCSFAFLLLYARRNSFPGSKPALSGRWS
ncbi:MAG: hypothetical protein K0U72_08560 [Gammaproteobacteria bacterium]|nr:hypothetical protein [Gammaproteobacteria bacterium]